MTLVTGVESTSQRPNIREVFVPNKVLEKMPNLFNTNPMKMTWQILPEMITACNEALATNEVQEILKEEFDLVMIYMGTTECFLSVVHEKKVN